MQQGDLVFFYHSGDAKEIVGLAKVARGPYPDPTAEEGDWVCVDLAPVKNIKNPVTLSTVKADAQLKDILLVRNSRLSVSPLNKSQFERILGMGQTKL